MAFGGGGTNGAGVLSPDWKGPHHLCPAHHHLIAYKTECYSTWWFNLFQGDLDGKDPVDLITNAYKVAKKCLSSPEEEIQFSELLKLNSSR